MRPQGAPEWEWDEPIIPEPDRPCARARHAAVLLPDGFTILVHGGDNPFGSTRDASIPKGPFAELHLLNTELWVFTRINFARLGARSGHTMSIVKDRTAQYLATFGGRDPDGRAVHGVDLIEVSHLLTSERRAERRPPSSLLFREKLASL